MTYRRLLVLAPHTDDAELGCGATISRLMEEGVEVHIAAFSTAEESLPPGFPPTTLRDEFYEAMRLLRIPPSNVHVFGYPVRRLSYHRQEVLEELVKLRRAVDPDIVFIPCEHDLHQDHQVMHAEGVRAFKHVTVWGYELPWNNIQFAANGFVTVEQRHLDAKWTALQAYRSQLYLERAYFTREFVEGLARVRGVQVRSEFAEAFDVMRIRW